MTLIVQSRQRLQGIGGQREALRSWVIVLIVMTYFLATAIFLSSIAISPQLGFAAVGLAMTATSWFPFVFKDQPWLSMWGLLSLGVTGAAGIRGIMMALDFPSDAEVDAMFLRGSSFLELLPAAALAIFIFATFMIGYIVGRSSTSQAKSLKDKFRRGLLPTGELSEFAIVAVGFGYAVAGAIGTYLYYEAVGGLEAGISERRTTIPGLQPTATFQSYGHLEFLSQAGHVAFLLLFIFWLAKRPRIGLLRSLALMVLFANALALNVVTTAREDLFTLGFIAVVAYVTVRGTVSLKVIVPFIIVAVIGITALSVERNGAGRPTEQSWLSYSSQSIFLNRNSFDLGKTLLVINAVPDRLPYEYGRTITTYVTGVVPRAIWPEKPIISPGPTIGTKIYGTTLTGVPPGMAAELVWNFGRLVAVGAAFFIGIGLGWLEKKSAGTEVSDLAPVLFYLFVVMSIGTDVVGTTIGTAIVSAILSALLLLPLAVFGSLGLHRVPYRPNPNKHLKTIVTPEYKY